MAFTAMKLEKHICHVQVLDGSEIQCEVANLTYGIDLLEYVCKKVGIVESSYFGLKYRHQKDGKFSWLQTNKFIGRQMRSKIYDVELHIKYWPSTPYIIEQDITRYQMVLEMRAKLLNGDLVCSHLIQALLASYLLQAELGDYQTIEKEGGYNKFISNETLQFFSQQPVDFMEKVKEFHEKHNGVLPSSAELLYLENARKILHYGMELHEVLDADNIGVILGINFDGVHILQNDILLNKICWPSIQNVKCKKNKRILYLKLNAVSKDELKALKIGFTSPTVVDWKRLYRSCRDHMAFFNASKRDMADGQKDDEKKASVDPAIRYSHCPGDHYKIAAPFVRINSIRFVQKKKKIQDKKADEEEKANETISSVNSNHEDEPLDRSAPVEETLPTETGEIVDTKQSTTDNRQDGTQQELALVQPSIPQVIISVTDDDFRPDNTDNQSFISTTTECDSVIENPMDSVKAGEKLTEDPSETTDSERSDLSEDISEDTVVVETTKVTSEEFDPGTTSVTVVTQTTVTEIESAPGTVDITLDESEKHKVIVDEESYTTTSSTIVTTRQTSTVAGTDENQIEYSNQDNNVFSKEIESKDTSVVEETTSL